MRVSRNVVIWLFASLLVLGVVSAAVANSLDGTSSGVASVSDDGTPDQGSGDRRAGGNSPDDDGTPDQGPGCCEPGDDNGGGNGHDGDDNGRHGHDGDDNSGPSESSGPGSRDDDDDDGNDDDDSDSGDSDDSSDRSGSNSGRG